MSSKGYKSVLDASEEDIGDDIARMYDESDFEEDVLMDGGSHDELEGLNIGNKPLLSASQLVEEMGDFSQGEEPGASLASSDGPSSWAKEMDKEFQEE